MTNSKDHSDNVVQLRTSKATVHVFKGSVDKALGGHLERAVNELKYAADIADKHFGELGKPQADALLAYGNTLQLMAQTIEAQINHFITILGDDDGPRVA